MQCSIGLTADMISPEFWPHRENSKKEIEHLTLAMTHSRLFEKCVALETGFETIRTDTAAPFVRVVTYHQCQMLISTERTFAETLFVRKTKTKPAKAPQSQNTNRPRGIQHVSLPTQKRMGSLSSSLDTKQWQCQA